MAAIDGANNRDLRVRPPYFSQILMCWATFSRASRRCVIAARRAETYLPPCLCAPVVDVVFPGGS